MVVFNYSIIDGFIKKEILFLCQKFEFGLAFKHTFYGKKTDVRVFRQHFTLTLISLYKVIGNRLITNTEQWSAYLPNV